jgi:hypothetical protein
MEFDKESLGFKLTVTSPSGKSVEIDPMAQVSIDDDRIKEQIKLLPSQYAFFTATYLVAKRTKDLAELDLSRIKNVKSKEIRNKYKKATAKGMEKELTIREVDEYLGEDEEIYTKEKELIELTIQTAKCYNLCQAIDKKQQALSSLSYMQMQERKLLDNLNKDSLLEDQHIQIDANLFEKQTKGETK